jgi:hypothetical protein
MFLCGFAFIAAHALHAADAPPPPVTDILGRPEKDPGAPLNLERYSPEVLPGRG